MRSVCVVGHDRGSMEMNIDEEVIIIISNIHGNNSKNNDNGMRNFSS